MCWLCHLGDEAWEQLIGAQRRLDRERNERAADWWRSQSQTSALPATSGLIELR
jgi:hypothetical protein